MTLGGKCCLSISGKRKWSALSLWSSTEVADHEDKRAFPGTPEDVSLTESYQMSWVA